MESLGFSKNYAVFSCFSNHFRALKDLTGSRTHLEVSVRVRMTQGLRLEDVRRTSLIAQKGFVQGRDCWQDPWKACSVSGSQLQGPILQAELLVWGTKTGLWSSSLPGPRHRWKGAGPLPGLSGPPKEKPPPTLLSAS